MAKNATIFCSIDAVRQRGEEFGPAGQLRFALDFAYASVFDSTHQGLQRINYAWPNVSANEHEHMSSPLLADHQPTKHARI